MESSHFLGSTNECSGTSGGESGWTTYIASSIYESYNHDDDDDDHNGNGQSTKNHRDYRKGTHGYEGESDDSMASDASSGPSHCDLACTNNEGNFGEGTSNYPNTKFDSKKKLSQQMKPGDGSRIKTEKQESMLKAKSAGNHFQSRSKVHVNLCEYGIRGLDRS